MRDDRKNLIVDLSFEFAIKSVIFAEQLEAQRKYSIARQFIRSATSIGANVREAQNSESKNDFIHKMKIAAKELDETKYWLQIIENLPNYPQNSELLQSLETVERVINKIISTCKKSIQSQK